MTFSNGQPFTADDVIFSFCRTLKNETAIAGSFADITGNFTAVEAPDPQTIVITTKAPDPLLPNFLSGLADPELIHRSAWQADLFDVG